MDFSWLADPVTWLGFATLIILEVVLGIDNLVFVAILAGKVRPAQRDRQGHHHVCGRLIPAV